MSGIVGLLNLDGEPMVLEVLHKMAQPLRAASPDGLGICHRDATGLGPAALTTAPGIGGVEQPFTLDGQVWVTADSCLCGKSELVRSLRSAGTPVASDADDPELLLLAYRAFGRDFPQRLVGDFALAIWDEARHTLVCARDHLGVRPFYYCHVGSVFLFGSDIDALLAHPAVSDEIREEYIADFLLFGSCTEPGITAFRQIRRLPAAHTLVLSQGETRLERYWTPPLHRTIRYPRTAEYTQHFAAIFEKAVTERMPAADVALDLSGGMDSSSIAAVAAAYAKDHGRQVTAYTNTCDRLIPEDKEGCYARMIAAYLNIPVHFFASENYPLFDRFDAPRLRTAEPFANPGIAQHSDKAQQMIDSGCRVMLSGQMGDTLFAGSVTYLPHLLKTGHLLRFLKEAYAHKKHAGTLKGTGLRAMLPAAMRWRAPRQPWQPGMPTWVEPEFAARVKLGERWRAIWQMWSDLNDTHGQLCRPWFSQFFEGYDAVKLPLVVRHPFSDKRLVEFMLGIPSFMHSKKRVLREAMRDRLPPVIVTRPKEGLPGDLRLVKMMAGLCRPIPPLEVTDRYIDIEKYRQAYAQFLQNGACDTTWSSWLINAPIALAYWMNNNLCDATQNFQDTK